MGKGKKISAILQLHGWNVCHLLPCQCHACGIMKVNQDEYFLKD